MKICKRALNFIQVIDELGNIRACSWMPDAVIGNMLETSFYEAYHSPKAQELRRRLAAQDYSVCWKENCPFLANDTIERELIEMPVPLEYPDELYLAYEGKCNYHCTCCTSYQHMEQGAERNWEENYTRIREGLQEVLPHVRRLGANGRGEIFCSPHIMEVLASWKPLAPAAECRAQIETNGSLFNAANWAKISNLGKYDLSVSITIMSFEEKAYQYLSGTKLPISNIINNLRFVKGLREQGVINQLTLATVVQERNFREMPSFTRRCLEEFGADTVRLRPIFSGGSQPMEVQWFADVRNPFHPYYEEFKEIMRDPIFRHPKVLKWSGDMDSSRGRFPDINLGKEKHDRLFALALGYKVLHALDGRPEVKQVVIYGAGSIGKRVQKFLSKRNSLTYELASTKGEEGVRCISEFANQANVLVVLATARTDFHKEMLVTCGRLGLSNVVQADTEAEEDG